MEKKINQLGGPAITREKKKGWLNTEIGYFSILATFFFVNYNCDVVWPGDFA